MGIPDDDAPAEFASSHALGCDRNHASASAPAASVRRVVKKVWDGTRRRTVVDDVSFDLHQGQLVVLRGPSGSGKTTLLALIGAMLSPTSGEVHLAGEATSRLRDAHRAEVRRRNVGFVFQDLHLVDGLCARDNVLLPCVPHGINASLQRRADALLDQWGVSDLADVDVRRLSGGERQRVALARAMIFDAPLLVLDEPTAHVDDARAHAIATELALLASKGRSVLVATHDARLANASGVDRVLTLVAGQLRPE